MSLQGFLEQADLLWSPALDAVDRASSSYGRVSSLTNAIANRIAIH